MPSAAVAKSEDKQSDSLSHETEAGTNGLQPTPGAQVGLPEFLRRIYGTSDAEAGMSEEEKEARGIALVSAEQIEESLTDALGTLHDGRKVSSGYLAGSALAVKRAIRQRLQSEKTKFEQKWEAEDIDMKAGVVAEYDSLKEDYGKRQQEAQQRVDVSVVGAEALFSEHRSNLDNVGKEGADKCEESHQANRRQIKLDYAISEEDVAGIGVKVGQRFDSTERGDAMRDGVMWIDGKVNQEMDDRLTEALVAIDNFYAGGDSGQSAGSAILAGTAKVQVGFDDNRPELIGHLQEMGPLVLDALESIAQQETSTLESIRSSSSDQMGQLKVAGLDRLDLLAQHACDGIDHALVQAQAALAHTEAGVRRQIEPLGKRAISLLRGETPTDPQDSRDIAGGLRDYLSGGADVAVRGMADAATGTAGSFWHSAAGTQTALAEESNEGTRQVIDLSLQVSDQVAKLGDERSAGMQDTAEKLSDMLDDTDQKLIDQFQQMVDEYRAQIQKKIDEMNAKLAEGLQAGKEKNREAVGTVEAAMVAEANDRANKYDHPVRHALWVGLQSGWAALKTTLKVLGFVVAAIVAVIVIALVLVLAGVEIALAVAIAKIVVAVAVVGYMAYQAYGAYRSRRAKGQGVLWSLVASGGDVIGVSDVYHGFTDEYLTMPERTEKIVSGGENLALLAFGGEINEAVADVARTRVPWLAEAPGAVEAPSLDEGSGPSMEPGEIPGDTGTSTGEAGKPASSGWRSRVGTFDPKGVLREMFKAQNSGKGGGKGGGGDLSPMGKTSRQRRRRAALQSMRMRHRSPNLPDSRMGQSRQAPQRPTRRQSTSHRRPWYKPRPSPCPSR